MQAPQPFHPATSRQLLTILALVALTLAAIFVAARWLYL
jgi:hypothetical protein